MRWNEMTAQEIVEAREKCGGVCILPMGCIERHGSHLPVAIDYMMAWHFADLAANLEPAMVFPPWYLGSLSDCSFAPGTIVFPLELCLKCLESLCSEIARNGYKKILLLNTHGGNGPLIDFFLQTFCEKDRDYMVYYPNHGFRIGKRGVAARERLAAETGIPGGHAAGYETAVALHLFPQCVRMDMMLPAEAGITQERSKPMTDAGLTVPPWWFSAYPHHCSSTGEGVTAEQGKAICDDVAQDIVEYIRAIKNDDTTLGIFREFRKKSGNPEL